MYVRVAGYDGFLSIVALSFGIAIMSWSSTLTVVIKVMINEVKNVACPMGALQ